MEAIGKLGENITLSRAQLILAPSDVQLFGYAHPKGLLCHNMNLFSA